MTETEISLQNPQHYPGLELRGLRRWLAGVVDELLPEPVSLGLRFASDRQIHQLNLRYRGRDRATDVLSFAGGETPDGRHLGDLVISVPTARRQAAAQGHGLQREIRELALHGVLHLLGHDHETDGGVMDRLEVQLRRRWIPTEGGR